MGFRAREASPTRPRPYSRRAWYYTAFVALLLVYIALTITIIVGSPLDRLDENIVALHIRQHNPGWNGLVSVLVVAGQRAPSTLVALPWFIWRSWRQRSARPLVLLGTGLLVLNLSVGVVKVVTGRVGPRHSAVAHRVLEGGVIFPSGHVSNAVILFGLLAWIAVRHRRKMIALAIAMPVVVGACTIYLKTHWLSDIVGAWMAGGLVLMVLPWVMPYSERFAASVLMITSRVTHQPELAELAFELRPVGAHARPKPAQPVAPRGVPEPARASHVPSPMPPRREARAASSRPLVSRARTERDALLPRLVDQGSSSSTHRRA